MAPYPFSSRKNRIDWLLLGAMAGLTLLGALCIMSAVKEVT